jgi:glutamate-1-semialdehyde 2,1-aminomutase
MAAGLATLDLISAPGFHARLAALTARLVLGLEREAAAAGVPLTTNHVPGMFGIFFSARKVTSYADATACDVERFKRFFHAMLAAGEYLAPSAYEAGFVSTSHTEQLIDATVAAAGAALR